MYKKYVVLIALLVLGCFCIGVVSAGPYVTYNANGATSGAVPIDNNIYASDDTVTVLGNIGNLVLAGYTFNDWNTAADGSGITYGPGGTFIIGSGGVTLYAQWTPLTTYTITYNPNGATNGTVPIDSNGYASGDNVTVLDNTGDLVRTGYAFKGWNTAPDGSGISYNPDRTFALGSADVTLYAQWDPLHPYPAGYTGLQHLESIGPDNPIYGLKIAMENFDESFTINQSDRLEKEITHTDLRLSELERSLSDNNTEAINRTLAFYWEKFNQTEEAFGRMGYNRTWSTAAWNISIPGNQYIHNTIPFINMLTRHEAAMATLTRKYPGRGNLKETYNHFQQRSQQWFQSKPMGPEHGNITPYIQPDRSLNFTKQSEKQHQMVNPGTQRGQGQSSDHQGNGNSRQHSR